MARLQARSGALGQAGKQLGGLSEHRILGARRVRLLAHHLGEPSATGRLLACRGGGAASVTPAGGQCRVTSALCS